jgi:predicted Rossmann-fold nucleotide-binding protein
VPRRAIIGAFGGDQQKSTGEEFGAAVTKSAYILLTAGDIRDDDEIKNATMIGAKCADNNNRGVARLIGILPKGIQKPEEKKWSRPYPRCVFLNSGLEHNVRNVINGVTPDVVVVFGGGAGTLAEAAFATAVGKKVIFYNGGVDQQKRSFIDRLKQNLHDRKKLNIDIYLREPLAAYANVFKGQTPESLKALLEKTLDNALAASPTDTKTLVAIVKNEVDQLRSLPDLTGFPGLADDPASIEKFANIVRDISS